MKSIHETLDFLTIFSILERFQIDKRDEFPWEFGECFAEANINVKAYIQRSKIYEQPFKSIRAVSIRYLQSYTNMDLDKKLKFLNQDPSRMLIIVGGSYFAKNGNWPRFMAVNGNIIKTFKIILITFPYWI